MEKDKKITLVADGIEYGDPEHSSIENIADFICDIKPNDDTRLDIAIKFISSYMGFNDIDKGSLINIINMGNKGKNYLVARLSTKVPADRQDSGLCSVLYEFFEKTDFPKSIEIETSLKELETEYREHIGRVGICNVFTQKINDKRDERYKHLDTDFMKVEGINLVCGKDLYNYLNVYLEGVFDTNASTKVRDVIRQDNDRIVNFINAETFNKYLETYVEHKTNKIFKPIVSNEKKEELVKFGDNLLRKFNLRYSTLDLDLREDDRYSNVSFYDNRRKEERMEKVSPAGVHLSFCLDYTSMPKYEREEYIDSEKERWNKGVANLKQYFAKRKIDFKIVEGDMNKVITEDKDLFEFNSRIHIVIPEDALTLEQLKKFNKQLAGKTKSDIGLPF